MHAGERQPRARLMCVCTRAGFMHMNMSMNMSMNMNMNEHDVTRDGNSQPVGVRCVVGLCQSRAWTNIEAHA